MFERLRNALRRLVVPDPIPPAPPGPNPTPTPPVPEPAQPSWVKRILVKYGPWLASIIVGYAIAYFTGIPFAPPPLPRDGGLAELVPVELAPGEIGATGWVKDQDAVDAVVRGSEIPSFGDTPAGRATMGDEDVFLWRGVRKVANRGPPWYPNINQGSVGCCVGAGWKHGTDVCQALQILAGRPAEWKPVSAEVIYGGSRVEVGGGRIRGDGSVGAWAAKWVRDYGVVPMEPVGGVDFSAFSPALARELGRTGIPQAIEDAAKSHPVKSTALVKSWADVKRAIQQGYPVVICSDQGFRMERDREGFCAASGTWMHCMVCIAVRSGNREGGFILNSWGDRAHTGPVWPDDAPVAGFWAEARVIDGMVRQSDSFALSEIVGFPHRHAPLDWFVQAAPQRQPLDPRPRLVLAW